MRLRQSDNSVIDLCEDNFGSQPHMPLVACVPVYLERLGAGASRDSVQ